MRRCSISTDNGTLPGQDIEQDSFIQVIKTQITMLNELRNDLWFYLVLPKEVKSLIFPNTTQLIYPLPTYPPAMRSHFDVDRFKKLFPHSLDIDLVYSHLPEATHAIKNTLFNLTHHIPNIFGYCHWFDLRQVVNWPVESFLQNITGLLDCQRVYLNTKHQKNKVLNQAKEHFNKETIAKLNKILCVQHLGVDTKDVVKSINTNPKKIIVFNHRPDTYKNYKGFIKVCDVLWEERKDFKVWVPLLDGKPNRPYLINKRGDKSFYYKNLQSCCVGFSPKQTYGGWSVATTDGMMRGVPYIMYKDISNVEIYPDADFFKNTDEAVSLLDKYLSNKSYRNKKAKTGLRYIRKHLASTNNVKEISDYIDLLVLDLPKITGSHINEDKDIFDKLYTWIRNAGNRKTPVGYTKEELFNLLGWGRGMKWTPYRQRLLVHGAIYDMNEETPMYIFSRSKSKAYQDGAEYKKWVSLIKKQDEGDKKIISKLRNCRIKH